MVSGCDCVFESLGGMPDVSNLSLRLTWAGTAARIFDVTAIVTSPKIDGLLVILFLISLFTIKFIKFGVVS